MGRNPHENGERFIIVTYHRVTKSDNADFIPTSVSCPARRFESHISVLQEHFSVLPLGEAWKSVKAGQSLPPRAVALTFDDCWSENVETVARPLSGVSMPATFFIPAGDVNREDLHADHYFFYLLKEVGTERLKGALSSLITSASVPGEPDIRPSSLRLWLEAALGAELESETGRAFLDSLALCVDAPTNAGLGKTLYMTAEHIGSLSDYGITVGNHTVSHRDLSVLSDGAQYTEILSARLQLSALSNQAVLELAYPYGRFNESSPAIAASTGHSCAVTVMKGYNDRHTDPWLLRRVDATQLSGEKFFRTLEDFGNAA